MATSQESSSGCGPLQGLLVVALEQAVAAPYCTSRLADAGARVIKIERSEGDFARGYDRSVHGESSYFVWINRGKESIALDLKQPDDRALVERMLEQADVFVQNLAPGAAQRLGLGSAELRARHPRLITCDISGYGEIGRLTAMKAYDLLVQAESGLVSVSGAPGEWGRIGVSLCDINAGLNALIGIQQALLARERSGRGSAREGVTVRHRRRADERALPADALRRQGAAAGRPEASDDHTLRRLHLRRRARHRDLDPERARMGRLLHRGAARPLADRRPAQRAATPHAARTASGSTAGWPRCSASSPVPK